MNQKKTGVGHQPANAPKLGEVTLPQGGSGIVSPSNVAANTTKSPAPAELRDTDIDQAIAWVTALAGGDDQIEIVVLLEELRNQRDRVRDEQRKERGSPLGRLQQAVGASIKKITGMWPW